MKMEAQTNAGDSNGSGQEGSNDEQDLHVAVTKKKKKKTESLSCRVAEVGTQFFNFSVACFSLSLLSLSLFLSILSCCIFSPSTLHSCVVEFRKRNFFSFCLFS